MGNEEKLSGLPTITCTNAQIPITISRWRKPWTFLDKMMCWKFKMGNSMLTQFRKKMRLMPFLYEAINFQTLEYAVFIIITVFCPRADPSLQAQEPRLQFCRRQIFHRKLRNKGCSFTTDWIGAVASRCFPHRSLSLFSIWTEFKRSGKDPRGTNVEVRRVGLANWALRTSPKFTTGDKYQFHQGFWPNQKFGNLNHPSRPTQC